MDLLGDKDITLSDAPAVPPSIMQGPMTRAQRRQLNLEVCSFLSDSFHTFENRLLPNDVILIRIIGEGHEVLRGSGGGDDDQPGRPIEARGLVQHDFESASASRPVCLELVTQDMSGLYFQLSIYGWKANLIRKPILVVSCQKLFKIHRNC
jgi:hypothetical protein